MNRQKSIKVRLTESEYELLKKQANGQPMASYMRSVCLGNSQTPSKNTPNIHPQLLTTFGPIILLSLYWKRVNRIGAFIGMLVGGTTVLIWEQLPLIKSGLVDSSNHTIYHTLAQTTGLYSLVIGFMLGLIIIVIVSLFTKAPDMITICEFEDVISNN